MILVVDSNVQFTFFWEKSVFREMSSRKDLILFSPEYALEEINKYSAVLLKKTGLAQKEFKELRVELAKRIEFVPLEEYFSSLKQVKSGIEDFPEHEKTELLEEADFLALASKLGCPLWSNDKLLKKQSEIIVLSTKEIISLL